MCSGLKSQFSRVFPSPIPKSADAYRDAAWANPQYAARTAELEKATQNGTVEQQKLFCEYAKSYVAEQQARAASIISRAQTLLVSQTLIGALLALATALAGHSDIVSRCGVIPLLLIFVGYTIVQILLLTINALRATAGLNVEYPGVSPLIRWLPDGELQLERNMGLALIKTYWDLDISNTWRANHFRLAQECLRNIIIALICLVVILVFAVI